MPVNDFQQRTEATKLQSNADGSRHVKRGAIPSPTVVKDGARKFSPKVSEHDGAETVANDNVGRTP
jgi:hypothetical protein